MDAVDTETPLARLRSATAAAHESIGQVPLLSRLFADDFQLAEYACLLRGLDVYHRELEAALSREVPTASLWAGLPYAPRSVFLTEDLRRLREQGVRAGRETPSAAPPAVPAVRAAGAAFGVRYVIEGSTLGAQQIRRRLVERFGEDVPVGFYAYGSGESAGAWKRYRDVLEDWLGRHPREVPAAVDAAVATFDTLAAWLRTWPESS